MNDSNQPPPLYSDGKRHVPPAGATTGWLETEAGRLRYASWPADGIAARGTVVFSHGLSEHIEKYANVIDGLRKRGYAVVAHDWRNHGLSAPYAASGDYFAQHDADFALLMHEVVLPSTPEPRYAIGHSMGGCLTLAATKNHPEWFKAVALCSPMLGIMAVRKVPMLKMVGKGLSFLPGKVRDMLNVFKASHRYTTSFINFEAYQEFVAKHPALKMDDYDLVQWFNSALARTTLVQKNTWLAQIETPVLLLLAGEDNLVDNDVAINCGTYLQNADLKVVDFAMHELFMEADQHLEKAWGALDSFLQAQAAAAAPAPSPAPAPAPAPAVPPAPATPSTLHFEVPASSPPPASGDDERS